MDQIGVRARERGGWRRVRWGSAARRQHCMQAGYRDGRGLADREAPGKDGAQRRQTEPIKRVDAGGVHVRLMAVRWFNSPPQHYDMPPSISHSELGLSVWLFPAPRSTTYKSG